MNSLIDLSGISRTITKTVSVVTKTVQPVTNVIEMATNSSQAWTENHAANLEAANIRNTATREILAAAKLRKAKAAAQRQVLDVDAFEQEVQVAVGVAAFKQRIHNERLTSIMSIGDSVVQQLAAKDNLTDADILRAAKVGSVAKPESDESTTDAFDLSQFTKA